MKKTLILLLAMAVMIPIATNAYTPRMITQANCNAQIQKVQTSLNNALKMIWYFQWFSYDTVDYLDCLRWSMRGEYAGAECNDLYYNYVDGWNLLSKVGMLKGTIENSN